MQPCQCHRQQLNQDGNFCRHTGTSQVSLDASRTYVLPHSISDKCCRARQGWHRTHAARWTFDSSRRWSRTRRCAPDLRQPIRATRASALQSFSVTSSPCLRLSTFLLDPARVTGCVVPGALAGHHNTCMLTHYPIDLSSPFRRAYCIHLSCDQPENLNRADDPRVWLQVSV